jgi:hypothetical protein
MQYITGESETCSLFLFIELRYLTSPFQLQNNIPSNRKISKKD